MHEPNEYEPYYDQCLKQALILVKKLSEAGDMDGLEILRFLQKYCYVGLPAGQLGKFDIHPWVARSGLPTHQEEGLAWIMCFGDDVAPVQRPQTSAFKLGSFHRKAQAIVIFDIDQWSPLELALVWLHEGRHARQRLGPLLQNLPLLEPEESHETNTWTFTLNILDVIGGQSWGGAVKKEMEWIAQHVEIPDGPTGIVFDTSGIYWPELDEVFEQTASQSVQEVRRQLLSIRAHIEYWCQAKRLRQQDVCHALVRAFYQEDK
jgi:hypothetical protein